MTSRLPDSASGRAWVWLGFALFVAIGFGWFGAGSEIVKANKLKASTTHSQGTISSISAGDSLNNPTAYYQFTVSGLKRWGYSNIPAGMSTQLGPGTVVDVTYLPEDPDTNAIAPEGMAESGQRMLLITCVIELVLAAIFVPLIITALQRPYSAGLSQNTVVGVIVFTLFAVAGLGILFGSALPTYQKSQELVAKGVRLSVPIDAVYDYGKSAGRYAEYTYSVNGKFYHGKSDYVGGYSDKGPIEITYLPSDPTMSAIDPQKAEQKAQWGVDFAYIWLGLLGLFVGIAVVAQRVRQSY